jgi:hypothetical protein
MAGSHDDTVLECVCHAFKGHSPSVNFLINGHEYNKGYYLEGGIYPRWSIFVKTISIPTAGKRDLIAPRREAYMKDVDRVFGVLQARFVIVWYPLLPSRKIICRM